MMLMTCLQALWARFASREEGQTAVEYGLVLALVALVIVAILATGATTVINTIVSDITAKL